jgi:hypothetical protein
VTHHASAGSSTSRGVVGRGAQRSARRCAAAATERVRPPLRSTSRAILHTGRPSRRAIWRSDSPRTNPTRISSRSPNPRRRPGMLEPRAVDASFRTDHHGRRVATTGGTSGPFLIGCLDLTPSTYQMAGITQGTVTSTSTLGGATSDVRHTVSTPGIRLAGGWSNGYDHVAMILACVTALLHTRLSCEAASRRQQPPWKLTSSRTFQ